MNEKDAILKNVLSDFAKFADLFNGTLFMGEQILNLNMVQKIGMLLFIEILNMSITAGITAFAVIAIRMMFKKAPKIYSNVLWLVVLFRLICPITIESVMGLVTINPNTIPRDIIYTEQPNIENKITTTDNNVNTTIEEYVPVVSNNNNPIPHKPIVVVVEIMSYIWIIGIVVLLSYSVFHYIKLKKLLYTATAYFNYCKTTTVNDFS